MDITFTEEQIDLMEKILQEDFIDCGVNSVILIDMGGSIIAEVDTSGSGRDMYSIAALAAGNYGAVCAMAKMIGQNEFSLLFHRGEDESMHFSKISSNFLLITIFGHETSLGLVRLRSAETANKLEKILESSFSE